MPDLSQSEALLHPLRSQPHRKYPDLKSNQNFQDLSVQLEGTENRIAIARQDYNTAATAYNTKRKSFPTNIVASIFGFQEKPLYKASEGAEQVPSVDFSS